MDRRHCLLQLGGAPGTAALPAFAFAEEAPPLRVAGGGLLNEREHQVGALQMDWAQGTITQQRALTLPTQPHAIVPEAGGGFLAVATRPGGGFVLTAQRANRIALWQP